MSTRNTNISFQTYENEKKKDIFLSDSRLLLLHKTSKSGFHFILLSFIRIEKRIRTQPRPLLCLNAIFMYFKPFFILESRAQIKLKMHHCIQSTAKSRFRTHIIIQLFFGSRCVNFFAIEMGKQPIHFFFFFDNFEISKLLAGFH